MVLNYYNNSFKLRVEISLVIDLSVEKFMATLILIIIVIIAIIILVMRNDIDCILPTGGRGIFDLMQLP